MTFAVCVTFTLHEGLIKDFLPLITQNAQTSLQSEPGCQRFDVLSDPARPTEVFLYELYDDAVAFQTHLATAHFQVFDRAVGHMIANKDVRTYEKVSS